MMSERAVELFDLAVQSMRGEIQPVRRFSIVG